MKKQLIAGLASLMMVVPTVGNIQAKSSSAKLMDQFVAAYRKGDYQKAKAVTNKMSATVEEPCAYKMSKAMKKAYKAKVKSYIKRYGADWSFDVPVSKTNQVMVTEKRNSSLLEKISMNQGQHPIMSLPLKRTRLLELVKILKWALMGIFMRIQERKAFTFLPRIIPSLILKKV